LAGVEVRVWRDSLAVFSPIDQRLVMILAGMAGVIAPISGMIGKFVSHP
jgi:hypothetical protein